MAIPEIGELLTGPHVVSLWTTLSGMLQGPSEVDYFMSLLGETLTRNQSAAEELRSLLEILSELRAPEPAATPDADGVSPKQRGVTLASANKELLQERLRQLIVKARTPIEEVFKTPREKRVAEILVRPPSSVGSSARSHDSRPTSVGGSSTRSTLADPSKGLEPLKRSLRFDKIDEAKQAVADCFQAEYDQMVADIQLVRSLIDEEIALHREKDDEPTVGELKHMTKRAEEAELHFEHVMKIQSLPSLQKRGSLAAIKH